jgi:ATP-dependent helicase HrpA
VELFDEPGAAGAAHVKGLARLLRLALVDQIRFLEKNLNVRAIGLMYAPFGGERELVTQLIEAAIRRACLAAPLPRSGAEFVKRRDEGRARLSLIAQEITGLVTRVLEAHQAMQKKLVGAKAFTAAAQDIAAQMQRLLPKDFIVALPYERLAHLPRYLQAISVRIDKLRADPARDTRLTAEFTPLAQAWQRRMIELARAGSIDPRLEEFRWLLEELRVSLFAQELRTPMPVSVKRLTKVWETYRSL